MKKLAFPVLAALLFAGTAQAAEVETVSVIVPYGDLDLTTEAGQAALDSRIDAAVDEVCARPEPMRNLKAIDAWADCRKGAAASAAEQVGAADMATETFAVLF
jgi:UrcA family protein